MNNKLSAIISKYKGHPEFLGIDKERRLGIMNDLNRRHITKTEFDSTIAPYKPRLIIQSVGVHYGSMLYFKMGSNPPAIDAERLQLTLEADWWTLRHNEKEVSSSTSIDRDFAETVLLKLMRGKTFLNLTIGDRVLLQFSDGWGIDIQPEHAAASDYDLLFSLYLPNKTCIVLTDDLLPQLAVSHESETSGERSKSQPKH
jgi:hypothetical protein